MSHKATIACLTGAGTAPELMAEAVLALEAVARLHGLSIEEVHVPFGGIKSSGFGPHEQGRAAIEFYTEVVTVYVDP